MCVADLSTFCGHIHQTCTNHLSLHLVGICKSCSTFGSISGEHLYKEVGQFLDTCTSHTKTNRDVHCSAQGSNGGPVPWVMVGAQDNRPKLYQTQLNTFQCSEDFFFCYEKCVV